MARSLGEVGVAPQSPTEGLADCKWLQKLEKKTAKIHEDSDKQQRTDEQRTGFPKQEQKE